MLPILIPRTDFHSFYVKMVNDACVFVHLERRLEIMPPDEAQNPVFQMSTLQLLENVDFCGQNGGWS